MLKVRATLTHQMQAKCNIVKMLFYRKYCCSFLKKADFFWRNEAEEIVKIAVQIHHSIAALYQNFKRMIILYKFNLSPVCIY